jgi:hypothetical protein
LLLGDFAMSEEANPLKMPGMIAESGMVDLPLIMH